MKIESVAEKLDECDQNTSNFWSLEQNFYFTEASDSILTLLFTCDF